MRYRKDSNLTRDVSNILKTTERFEKCLKHMMGESFVKCPRLGRFEKTNNQWRRVLFEMPAHLKIQCILPSKLDLYPDYYTSTEYDWLLETLNFTLQVRLSNRFISSFAGFWCNWIMFLHFLDLRKTADIPLIKLDQQLL